MKFKGSLTFSFETTLKEKEQIKNMIQSTFSDLGPIDLEGVNHVVMDLPMI